MKNILTLLSISISGFLYSQINIITNPDTNSLSVTSNAFLDASSNYDPTVSNSNNIGKGLVFPQVDLTSFEFNLTDPVAGAILPTYYDGMIVYNVGDGSTVNNPAKGGVKVGVKPGFYYFYNPDGRTNSNVNTGRWIPIGGSSKTDYTNTATPTGEFFDYQSAAGATVDKRAVNRIKMDLTFNGTTYAEVPGTPFTAKTVLLRSELIDENGKVVLNSAEYRHQYDKFTNPSTPKNYVLAAYGNMYNTLNGKYTFIAEYYEKP